MQTKNDEYKLMEDMLDRGYCGAELITGKSEAELAECFRLVFEEAFGKGSDPFDAGYIVSCSNNYLSIV
jgi:hypothetical protein